MIKIMLLKSLGCAHVPLHTLYVHENQHHKMVPVLNYASSLSVMLAPDGLASAPRRMHTFVFGYTCHILP